MFNRSKKQTPPKPLTTPPAPESATRLSVADAIAPREPTVAAPKPAETPPAPEPDRMSSRIEAKAQSMVSTGDMAPTVIQRDMVLKGMILTDGAVELHGVIDGDVCAKSFTLGDAGSLRGDVVAEQVQIAGEGQGRITARQVRLGSGARYQGDILHQRLSIEDGAEFEGAVLRKTDEAAWAEISKTFDTPGVELTEEAIRAVDALKAEFERRKG